MRGIEPVGAEGAGPYGLEKEVEVARGVRLNHKIPIPHMVPHVNTPQESKRLS